MNNPMVCTTSEAAYCVGALLYTPANRSSIAQAVCQEHFSKPYSLALCLEDTVPDHQLAQAEQQAIQTIQNIYAARQHNTFYLPKIFLRLRAPEQLARLLPQLGQASELVTGFIFPKFSSKNAAAYLQALDIANGQYGNQPFYMMPVLEDDSLISPCARPARLEALKMQLDAVKPLVLNIRVGCNDLCHLFGLRRQPWQTIYQILPVAQILSDILAIFLRDYVVSAPVWEYFQDDTNQWKVGLEQELELDLLNGFIGKTVIHPKQIAVVNQGLRVSRQDYNDASQIMSWDTTAPFLVSGGASHTRMNEYKTHQNWAQRTLLLAKLYGIQER